MHVMQSNKKLQDYQCENRSSWRNVCSKKIHDLCALHGVRLWVGGMLEAGISRAHNIALATLPSFTIPGDISASSRYWEKDIIKPEVEVEAGVIKVKEKPGIGYDIDKKFIKTITAFEKEYK